MCFHVLPFLLCGGGLNASPAMEEQQKERVQLACGEAQHGMDGWLQQGLSLSPLKQDRESKWKWAASWRDGRKESF